MKKSNLRFKEFLKSIGTNIKKMLNHRVSISKAMAIITFAVIGVMLVFAVIFMIEICKQNNILTQKLNIAESSLQTVEKDLQTVEKDLQAVEKDRQTVKKDFINAKQENEDLNNMIKKLKLEIEELQTYKEEFEVQQAMEKLEKMKNDPNTPTLDFLPYLQGDFEENVKLMSTVIFKEAGNGGDEEQQLQGLVLLARCFHPTSFSEGNGNLRSAILSAGQYPWAASTNIDSIKPNESSIRNARAVLTGQVLDTKNIKGVTRNVEYANTTPLGYATYCKIWNEGSEKWVYFGYGY